MRVRGLANAGLALVSTLLAVALAWAALESLGRDPSGWIARAFGPEPPTLVRIGIWRDDSMLGFAHLPNATGTHVEDEFSVTYTIGPDGCRVVPGTAHSGRAILFLGGSFTFGQGVEDGETYPALLARRFWSGSRVRNCAVMAWGTSNAYLFLAQELEAARQPPRAVIYGWHTHHALRNYLSKKWLRHLAQSGRKLPHFEIEDGRPAFQGTVGAEAGIERSAELRWKESELTRVFLLEMDRLCRERGIPFRVLILGHGWVPNSPRDDRLIQFLRGAGVGFLDLREASDSYFPKDQHPTPAWHAAVAEAIAAAGVLE